LRCINIDCVFNSSNQHGAIRNTCCHPNVVVESRFADITIAICSEFRSKKDYVFERPSALTDLKTKEKIEIVGKPAVGDTTEIIEAVTTKELEEGIDEKPPVKSAKVTQHGEESQTAIKPVVIESAKSESYEELTPAEIYNLSTKPGTDFLILKKLYQPYTKRGLAGSIILHIVLLLVLYQFLMPDKGKPSEEHNQRIVIVEDLEMPKFDPPDIDKIKEEEQKLKDGADDIKDNTKDVRPNITKKIITPKINRPRDTDTPPDTNASLTGDTSKVSNDSLLANRDTTRYIIPDSLRTNFSNNDVGLNIVYPAGWKLIDNRVVNMKQEEFNGVMLGIDSTSEDYGKVQMIINIDDPAHPTFNKGTYKTPFEMNDSLITAFQTDPIRLSGKKSQVKYYLFTDPTGQKNIQISAEFDNDAIVEKYRPVVDAIVRTIKIAPPPESKEP
jgi:hypothetical protein